MTYLNPQLSRRENYLQNGDLNFWQPGISFTAADDETIADRWYLQSTFDTGVMDVARSTDVPSLLESGQIFNYSMLFTVTTADAAPGVNTFVNIHQKLHGWDMATLQGQECVLSFWAKANHTATYSIFLKNNANDRTYIADFTIDSANTWEHKRIPINFSDQGGNWNYGEFIGLRLAISLQVHANLDAAEGSWQAGNFFGSTTQGNFLDTVSNTFQFTGAELQLGSVYDRTNRRPLNDEFALCEAQWQQSIDYDSSSFVGTVGAHYWINQIGTSDDHARPVEFRTPMKGTVNVNIFAPTSGTASRWRNIEGGADVATALTSNINLNGFVANLTPNQVLTVGNHYAFHWLAFNNSFIG